MFDMGEHAIYVWPAYIIVLLVLAWNLIGPVLRHKRLLMTLAKRLRREPR